MSGKKDQPVEEDGKGASSDPRPFEEAVADTLKVKKPEGPEGKAKKARSRERKRRNVGPFE